MVQIGYHVYAKKSQWLEMNEEVIEEEKVVEPVNPLGKFGIQVQDRYEDI